MPSPVEPSPYALSMSRRFHFCASHRLRLAGRGDDDNRALFGDESLGAFGHGHNYVTRLVFSGPLDRDTGIIANLTEIKRQVAAVIDQRYDHKHLNADTPPFDSVPPTPENVAREILSQVATQYRDRTVRPLACHLEQSSTDGATAYADGRVERHCWMSFSAARVTRSPHLSEDENRALFGEAADPAGHGHNYRLRVTLAGEVSAETGVITPAAEIDAALAACHAGLDHRHLNLQVPLLEGLPTTTEVIARAIHARLAADLPVARVRLYELPDFFAEVDGDTVRLGVVRGFFAAHRLHSPLLSDDANRALYGKCNNPAGHGHSYSVEGTVAGALDERTGTLCSLDHLTSGLEGVLDGWSYRHLDAELDVFRHHPSTGENIVSALWRRLASVLPAPLVRLRLGETENNRFTVRREPLVR